LPLSGREWPKLYCIIHELGLTIINCLIAILHYSANKFLPARHVLSVVGFFILTFVRSAPEAGGCQLHTLYQGSGYCSLFPLLAQPYLLWSMLITLYWQWTTDATAPGVVGRSSGLTWNGVWRCFVLWFFVFPEFCVLRSFRTVEFVAATFMRHGRKQLHYWRAEGECAMVLWGRLYVYVFSRWNISVSSHNTECYFISTSLYSFSCRGSYFSKTEVPPTSTVRLVSTWTRCYRDIV
jgi:hypothetical protein